MTHVDNIACLPPAEGSNGTNTAAGGTARSPAPDQLPTGAAGQQQDVAAATVTAVAAALEAAAAAAAAGASPAADPRAASPQEDATMEEVG